MTLRVRGATRRSFWRSGPEWHGYLHPVPVIVGLLGAILCALVVVLAAETAGRGAVAGDTEGTEHWLVDQISDVPGLRRAIAALVGWISSTPAQGVRHLARQTPRATDTSRDGRPQAGSEARRSVAQ